MTADGPKTDGALSPACRERIRSLIPDYPEPRGALLPAVHLAQEELGYVTLQAMEEIAALLGLRPIDVREVVSFYPRFRDHPVGRRHIQICTNIACALRGARGLVRTCEERLGIRVGEVTPDGAFSLEEVECLGSCGTAPVVQVNGEPYRENVDSQSLAAILDGATLPADFEPPLISSIPEGIEGYLLPANGEHRRSLDGYRAAGGYAAAEKAYRDMSPEEIVEAVKASNLRGRGGAGFGMGLKWGFMPKPDGSPRYIACNSDESEPATYKDRQILQRNPHLLLEGLLIMARAIHANAAYIYIRGEYATPYRILRSALDEAYAAGILGPRALGGEQPFHVYVTRGGGAYICGEETGMMESVEGKKGQPRKRPPFPAVSGLWRRPTAVNNVETISHLPALISRGVEWFRSVGTSASTGHTLFGVSGHVRRPGVYELPLGTTLREIIYRHAGGIREDRKLKAIVPGGVSMKVLTADQVDVPMDHDSLRAAGSLLGTGGIVAMDETTCMVRSAIVIGRFFRHETCGQCTQCREGTSWLHKLLLRIERGEAREADLRTIEDVCGFMEGQTICVLSDAAAWAASSALERFRPDFEAHVREGRCPFPGSFEP